VNKAICIYPDNKGNVWFGTTGGGLSEFDYTTNRFTHFTELDGLANNTVSPSVKVTRKIFLKELKKRDLCN
jgi:hypothetical protein